MAFLYRIFVFIQCGFLFGCASIPLEPLANYSEAFQQARNAGELLLDEISPTVAGALGTSADGQSCGTSRLGYPLCFDPELAAGNGARANEPASIRARRDALAAVSLYNQMLVDLAEGKPETALRSRIDELAGFAGSIAKFAAVGGALPALIGPGAVFVRDLASRLEAARARAALRAAILDSRPAIQDLIAALTDDTKHIYNVFKNAREKDLININHDRNVARLSNDASGQARASERYDATLQSIDKFHESLTAYVLLLNATSGALDVLADAARQASTTTADLALVFEQAAEIRIRSQEFWQKIREVRTTAFATR